MKLELLRHLQSRSIELVYLTSSPYTSLRQIFSILIEANQVFKQHIRSNSQSINGGSINSQNQMALLNKTQIISMMNSGVESAQQTLNQTQHQIILPSVNAEGKLKSANNTIANKTALRFRSQDPQVNAGALRGETIPKTGT